MFVVPFDNMIYIGDGLTDVPSMKLTRQRGGYAIGVYRQPEDALYLVDEDRVDFYVRGDYTEGSEMDRACKAIFEKIQAKVRFFELSHASISRNDKDWYKHKHIKQKHPRKNRVFFVCAIKLFIQS